MTQKPRIAIQYYRRNLRFNRRTDGWDIIDSSFHPDQEYMGNFKYLRHEELKYFQIFFWDDMKKLLCMYLSMLNHDKSTRVNQISLTARKLWRF